jgi:hypothetical protein
MIVVLSREAKEELQPAAERGPPIARLEDWFIVERSLALMPTPPVSGRLTWG